MIFLVLLHQIVSVVPMQKRLASCAASSRAPRMYTHPATRMSHNADKAAAARELRPIYYCFFLRAAPNRCHSGNCIIVSSFQTICRCSTHVRMARKGEDGLFHGLPTGVKVAPGGLFLTARKSLIPRPLKKRKDATPTKTATAKTVREGFVEDSHRNTDFS